MAPKNRSKPVGGFREKLLDEAEKQGVDVVDEEFVEVDEPEQKPLISTPAKPMAIRNGRMFTSYTDAVFSMDARGKRWVSLCCSMELTDEHDGRLPGKIERAYRAWKKDGFKRIDCQGITPHRFELFLVPDHVEPKIVIQSAIITDAKCVEIEEVGKGKARQFCRLSFRAKTEVGPSISEFAVNYFGGQFWLGLSEPQGKLKAADAGE